MGGKRTGIVYIHTNIFSFFLNISQINIHITMRQVLGHVVRSDIHKPRELLALPKFDELDSDDGEDDQNELKSPFSSKLWSIRVAVQRGYEALFTVQVLILFLF